MVIKCINKECEFEQQDGAYYKERFRIVKVMVPKAYEKDTSAELSVCPECGIVFATKEQIEWIR